jgi:excisionase family DNA binding protein
MADAFQQWLRVKAVAKVLDCKPPKVTKLIRDGLLPASDISGGLGRACWRIKASDLEAFLLARQHHATGRRRRRRKPATIRQYF